MSTERIQRHPYARPRGAHTEHPIIGFMTDFGVADDAVALCKGLMLSVCPGATIVDISHATAPFDVERGSRLLNDLPSHFPPWSKFASIIYPQTGSETGTIAIAVPSGHVYVAPNNGLLTVVLEQHGYTEAYEVTNTEIVPAEPEPTFYGRDLVALSAAGLAAGFPLDRVGRRLKDSDIKRYESQQPEVSDDGHLVGVVSEIDRPFGNVWTNIHRSKLDELGIVFGAPLKILLDHALTFELPLTRTFADRPVGTPVAYVSSRGYLALALNQGDLAKRYNITKAMSVKLKLD